MMGPLRALIALLLMLAAMTFGSLAARADEGSDADFNGTHIDFTPYLWLPTINSSLSYKLSDLNRGGLGPGGIPIAIDLARTFDLQAGPSQYLSKLNFALMGELSLRHGNFSGFVDVINMNAGNQSLTVGNVTGPNGNLNVSFNNNASGQIVATMMTYAGAYTLLHHGGTNVDFLVGGRYLQLSTNGSVLLTGTGGGPFAGQTFSAGVDKKETDSLFVLGVKGQIHILSKLNVIYYGDWGPETLYTDQLLGGLKYGNLSLLWRHIQFNNPTPSALVQRFDLDGPAIAYTLRLF
jgi:hypothetical protein